MISIPAPAQGATYGPGISVYHKVFQSPPPRRGRLQLPEDEELFLIISIPAPAQGATVAVGHPPGAVLISIPAPAQGATLLLQFLAPPPGISIPAPAQGATDSLRTWFP